MREIHDRGKCTTYKFQERILNAEKEQRIADTRESGHAPPRGRAVTCGEVAWAHAKYVDGPLEVHVQIRQKRKKCVRDST